ncbi:Pyruvate/Phosphoenolpyruvate kinase-like domain-containing protein [Aspergillus alliaceus]|uniref:Pyruvate/Phosphoenolpyruvate kinase-like domain-containing protein n=1 Tax=Petromyces alliaceus TaxID=209559 RepID=UPI0012A75044|nr:Pyruvate/Phosphoenolpyruvate kinase-like domain-containing protein [Aspergillus alliaceus]KAB8236243.1 Pyruvate/Phosphoenolpyruvate kinase-like domain-containing protein [Aspergillus alliaceus]
MAVGCNDSDCLNNSATDHKHGDMRDYIAPSLFQPHRVRLAIRDAHEKKIPPLIGYYAGPPAVSITHWLAPMGFDYVWIDWEYNATNIETMTTTAFMSSAKTIPFVRVPGHDASIIGYALNAGASIIVPHVDMVEEAKHVVSAVKLTESKMTALMIQIESLEGIHNLDAILTKVPEIDIVWFGTIDARMSMGLAAGFGVRGSEPKWLGACDLFHATFRKYKKPHAGFSFVEGEELRKATSDMAIVYNCG